MKEEEIRPKKIFDEYLRLARKDAITFFKSSKKRKHPCPACAKKGLPVFTKQSFKYESCPKCYTLFVNPRPTAKAFSKYYTESQSSKYWATTFYRVTAKSRRKKLWRPKARDIYDILKKYSEF